MAARGSSLPKTHAKEAFCLSEKDLETLSPRLKANPRARKSGPPMKLYNQDELQALAVAKFGTLEAVEAERDRRLAVREQRAEAKLQ
ncbi:hypothetical protein WJX81_002410, partial [Elliptochloris bilobata]